jgi:acetaldehyde dehydrogenase
MSTEKTKVAIIGTGNIGTDLLMKLRASETMEVACFAGIDPASAGIARATELGVPTSSDGLDGVLEADVKVVFDATSAGAHRAHAPRLEEAGIFAVDLTPAHIGPLVVPAVNLDEHLGGTNVNLITCGGQATIPIVHALHRVAPLKYAEMVSTISSLSAGPGTRQNIDEFTRTTSGALQQVGGAAAGKAIMILNPADPPILMGNTLFAVPEDPAVDEEALRASVDRMVEQVSRYVPGYRLKVEPVIDQQWTPWGERTVVIVLLQVEGAGDFLPPYAGNLDIMTAAACQVGERWVQVQREGLVAA